MRRMKSTIPAAVVFALVLALALAGCGENSPSGTRTQDPGGDEGGDLNAEFGGYTMTDEAEAFGDVQLKAEAEDGEPAEDPVEEMPEVVALGALQTTDVYVLRIAWGMLHGDSSNTVVTDWSGSIAVDTGAIFAERALRFERTDSIVRPRTDRRVLELVSETAPHWDGIVLTVLDPNPGSPGGSDNQVAIDLGPFQMAFAMEELVSIDTVFDVDAIGNQFSVAAFLLEEYPCGRGFVSGHWIRSAIDGGEFRGRWTTQHGSNRGFLRGHWGVDDDGMRVFFGKYIGEAGEFLGLLRGKWGPGRERDAGWFRGVWRDEAGIQGSLHGVWKSEWRGPRPQHGIEEGRGFFHGRWTKACNPAEVTDELE